MLTFATFLWAQKGYPTQYTDAHVRRWVRMVDTHYAGPHRCVVVTSLPGDYGGAAVVPEDTTWDRMANPEGANFPSCYRRLRVWAPNAGEFFGERVVVMDLDCTILQDIAPLFDRDEPVVLLRDALWARQYNGSVLLLSTGARTDVWERFEGAGSVELARRDLYRGSDQGWISYILGPGMPCWTAKDGIHSWKRDLHRGLPLPNSRLVQFHGKDKPWHPAVPVEYR